MAERKRGLGKGLGALIPDVVTEERPVDVFFGNHSDVDGDVSHETERSKDPAEGMRKARAEKKSTPRRRKTSSPATSTTPAGAQKTRKKTAASGSDGEKKGRSPAKARSGSPAGRSAAQDSARARQNKKESAGTPATAPAAEAASSLSSPEPVTDDVSRETELKSVPGTAFGLIPLEQIKPNPRQPRQVFDEDALDELVHSIREVGVLQPVVVRLVDGEAPAYELIMGERRFRASQLAGAETIPAIIRVVEDNDLLRDALLENLHRADLNPLEEAAAYEQLLEDFQCTQEELSTRIGRSRPQISNTLRLLKLPPLVQRRVAAGVISQGHARAILGVKDPGQMEVLAQRIVAEGLSVRATEEAVVLLNRGEKERVSRGTRAVAPELADLASKVGDRLDTRVSISMGKKKGKLSVEFANEDDLRRILAALGVEPGDQRTE